MPVDSARTGHQEPGHREVDRRLWTAPQRTNASHTRPQSMTPIHGVVFGGMQRDVAALAGAAHQSTSPEAVDADHRSS